MSQKERSMHSCYRRRYNGEQVCKEVEHEGLQDLFLRDSYNRRSQSSGLDGYQEKRSTSHTNYLVED